jgi:hypothetical protein
MLGLQNISDWNGYANALDILPSSCCIASPECKITSNTLYTENCLTSMVYYLQTTINVNSGVLIAHSTIALISSIISFVFYNFFKYEKKFIYQEDQPIMSTARSTKTQETEIREEVNRPVSRKPSNLSNKLEPQPVRKFSIAHRPSITDIEGKF